LGQPLAHNPDVAFTSSTLREPRKTFAMTLAK
jgi:hypothetical protein